MTESNGQSQTTTTDDADGVGESSSDASDDEMSELCVSLAPPMKEWLTETAETCNTTPDDLVKLLVLGAMYGEDVVGVSGAFDADGDSEPGKTRQLLKEALAKMDAVAKQSKSPIPRRNKAVRSLFEWARGEVW